MKLATIRVNGRLHAARLDNNYYVTIEGYNDVGSLLQTPDWETIANEASGPRYPNDLKDLAPVIPRPGKIICVGANYSQHISEMGSEVPSHPTLFAKYTEALVGAYDPIEIPSPDAQVDWEGELAVIIGKTGRFILESAANDYIAGYSVMNDVSMRKYQFRSMEWLQGKTWENSSPFGPHLVTPDEFELNARIKTSVNDEVVQEDFVNNTVFSISYLISYASEFITLKPGDVIITGTPAGVGIARTPQQFLEPEDTLETTITGLGSQKNEVVTMNIPASIQ